MVYTIYTDGSITKQHGLGSWVALVSVVGGEPAYLPNVAYWGTEASTTSNRVELLAVIKAIETLGTNNELFVVTDSRYVERCINGHDGEANPDLLADLRRVLSGNRVDVTWVRGHSGVEGNEFCDRLAKDVLKDPEHFQGLDSIGAIKLRRLY